MATLIPYFSYTKRELTVKFKDMSFGNPTIYKWGFGDGNSSGKKNPKHTYEKPGVYKVTLQVAREPEPDDETIPVEPVDPPEPNEPETDDSPYTTFGNESEGPEWDWGWDDEEEEPEGPIEWGDSSEILEFSIVVGDIEEISYKPLPEIIDEYMPTALLGSASISRKITLINKWRVYLQPLVYLENPDPGKPVITIPKSETHNEMAWPTLFNYLIAQLVAHDIILQGANQFLANVGRLGGEVEGNIGDTGTIKSIETGPTKSEWWEDMTAEGLEKLAKVYEGVNRNGGILEQLKESICQLSSRLRIYLPMCGQLNHNTTPIQVTHTHRGGHNANPFGITKRMI